MFRLIGMSLALTTVLLTAAQADPFLVRKDVRVSYRHSEISTEAGARAVLARINAAARKACGGSPTFYGTYSMAPGLARKDFAKCQASAVGNAVAALNAPMLVAVYSRDEDAALRLAGR
jgi:UrcA family protein